MEEPHKPRQFLELLDHFGDMVDHLLFASDYPHWDADDPDDSWPTALSDDIRRKIYHDNAAKLFGLD
jgi:predicted TIM-barrel fold metal-dependent hydrolase